MKQKAVRSRYDDGQRGARQQAGAMRGGMEPRMAKNSRAP